MATENGENKCPYCEELVRPGRLPAGCPYADRQACALFSGVAETLPETDRLSETIPYERQDETGELDDQFDDGFPLQDDLISRMLGQYRMGPVIGRGTMGRVYRAEHAGLGRTCAVKVMNPSLVKKHPQILERFWAEARALAGLVHPHLVTVHNLGSDRGYREVDKKWGKHERRVREFTDHTYHYIEMEYVPGGMSLKETLVHEGALTPLRATTLVYQVAQALSAAHRAGLIHRDVKPANVLLTGKSTAKLADFGLVRGVSAEELAGAPIAGTPTFMAPELFRGRPGSVQSDIYAVGVMYYYLLSARLPFAADSLGLLIQLHQHAPVPEIRRVSPDIPDGIASILERSLAKTAAARHSSAEELSDELQNALSQLRDIDSLIRESLEGIDGVVEGERDRWRILLKVPGGRFQEVRIEVSQGLSHRRLLNVYSVCCPSDPSHYEFALKLNAELSYGGLSIYDVDGKPMFVMTRTYPGGNATPEEVRAAVHEIARRSDWVEQQLTNADVF